MAFASWEWHLHSPQPQPRCLPRGLLLPQIVLPPCLAGCSGCCWGPWRFLRVRGALPCSPPPLLPAPCSGMRRCRAERRPPVLGAVSFRQQGQGQRARVGREPLGRDGAGGGRRRGERRLEHSARGERGLRGACRLPAQADINGDRAASIQGGPLCWGAWPLPGEGVEARRLEGKRLLEASPNPGGR